MTDTTITPKLYRDADGTEVEAIQILTADDVRALRASDWSEDQVRLLTYPTHAPIAFVGLEAPLEINGREVSPGNFVIKGPAGDLTVKPAVVFAAMYTEVA